MKLKNTGIDYLLIYENIEESEIHKKDIIKTMGNGELKKLLSVVDLRKQFPLLKIATMK